MMDYRIEMEELGIACFVSALIHPPTDRTRRVRFLRSTSFFSRAQKHNKH